MILRTLALLVVLLALAVPSADAFKDIECKANTEMMITKPGSYERVVKLVAQAKVNAAKTMVVCTIHPGRGVFIVGKPARGKESFVPVSTGDCIGETYRAHLTCPGDKRVAKKPTRRDSRPASHPTPARRKRKPARANS